MALAVSLGAPTCCLVDVARTPAKWLRARPPCWTADALDRFTEIYFHGAAPRTGKSSQGLLRESDPACNCVHKNENELYTSANLGSCDPNLVKFAAHESPTLAARTLAIGLAAYDV